MKFNKTSTVSDWKAILDENVQLEYADIPTGATRVEVNEKGREVKKMITQKQPAFGFQTESARGKGVQWIPLDNLEEAMQVLRHYADNGVETIIAEENWLSPAEAIHETIAKVPRIDGEGNVVPGYDIAFRVRQGKGSKSCRVPEEDFGEFVDLLGQYVAEVPKHVKALEAAYAKAEAAKKV